MKILLLSLNTKYIHSNLAIQYLKAEIGDKYSVDTKDFTINQNLDDIIYDVIRNEYNIVGFSTYIWNIDETLKICKKLKKIDNELIIILGGPEVSFNGKEIINNIQEVNYIVSGEGESSFKELLDYINETKLVLPEGVIKLNGDKIVGNTKYQVIKDLENSKFQYEESYLKDKKIVYYETSRGCPYNCEFCLSSSTKKVRYFNIDRCLNDIKKFIDYNVPLVKFIDRTFNYNKSHSLTIIKFIIDNDSGNTTFHLEIHPTLIDKEYLNLFKKARKDLFQFEIGVQSTNEETCKAIKRVGEFEQIKSVCKEILTYDNIHLHLDLIAGLPYEDYNSFKDSFNDILSIRPDKLQLGFLKVLKGSPLWFKSEEYNIVYDDNSPYEVIYTKWISYNEIQKLKQIENLVDKYYNEKYFINTFEFIIKSNYKNEFNFFEDFSNYWDNNDYYLINHSRDSLYKILYDFIKYKNFEKIKIYKELLTHDYILTNKKIPFFLNPNILENNYKHEILKNDVIIKLLESNLTDLSTKKLVKFVFIIEYNYDIICINKISGFTVKNKKTTILYETINNRIYNIGCLLKEE